MPPDGGLICIHDGFRRKSCRIDRDRDIVSDSLRTMRACRDPSFRLITRALLGCTCQVNITTLDPLSDRAPVSSQFSIDLRLFSANKYLT
jgi:hypothetical protein